jgi:outer membrane protein
MTRRFLSTWILAMGIVTAACAADPQSSTPSTFGIVSFGACLSDSKLGKQEQTAFEVLKAQITSTLEETEKQLNRIAEQLNNPEYLDGLSPQAEEELKTKFRTLSEEMNRYQNQYYQVLNQANMRIVQTIGNGISAASEKVAKDKKLSAIVNKDACFFFAPGLEVTKLVIDEMDKNYEIESKKQAAAATPSPAAIPAKNSQEESKKQTASAPASTASKNPQQAE